MSFFRASRYPLRTSLSGTKNLSLTVRSTEYRLNIDSQYLLKKITRGDLPGSFLYQWFTSERSFPEGFPATS